MENKEMNKQIIEVPKGIRYLSDWKEFSLPDHPCIINKTLTGCGFTEWCLRPNPKLSKVILVSPRRILLENKEDQHNNPKGQTKEEVEYLKKKIGPVYYARNNSEFTPNIDSDLNKNSINEVSFSDKSIKESILNLRKGILNYYNKCTVFGDGQCKIIVTYDSFRHVKEVLGNNINQFHVVVDEFQSIFTDATFKSDTELELQYQLKDLQKVCYVSATPMMDRFLKDLDEFKNLPYYELNWEIKDPNRVKNPKINYYRCNRLLDPIQKWINKYLSGNFDKKSWIDENGKIQEIYSKELVIYINSVSNICSIIKSCKLTPDQCNVLCANTPENLKKIKSAFKKVGYSYDRLGTVPDKGQPHKMFTFCTRTVYLGADFYSTNAQTIIFSDSNIDCLSVDISLDLPQILGRQRLDENPWKDEATLYYKTTYKDLTREEFDKRINKKKEDTNILLNSYKISPSQVLADRLMYTAKSLKYKKDYVAVNKHGGNELVPVFNNLVMIAEKRSYEIQQEEFKDQVSVLNTLRLNKYLDLSRDPSFIEFIDKFNQFTQFTDKLELICEYCNKYIELIDLILDQVPFIFGNYYRILGPDVCRKYSYRKSLLESEYLRIKNNKNIDENFILKNLESIFIIGEKYSKIFIKKTLQKIFDSLDLKRKAKATDLEEWFELKPCKINNKETGKRDMGFEIIKKKE